MACSLVDKGQTNTCLLNYVNHMAFFKFEGVDSDDTLVYSHQMDMFADPSPLSWQLNKCAYLELLLVEEIHKITHQNVDNLLKTSAWQIALQALLSKYCKKAPLPVCDAHARFRSIDGSCNNLRYPRRGMSFRPQKRYLRPVYDDGIDFPRSRSVYGHPLPSPRRVSNYVFRAGSEPIQHPDVTVMHMSFGQFLDHDLIFTPVIKGENGSDINCCYYQHLYRPECFPIHVPANDQGIQQKCINMVRSSAAVDDTFRGYRDQTNEVTSYLDASNVYGSTTKKMDELRSHVKGLLKVDEFNRLPVGKTKCFKDVASDYCQNAGDKRVNVVPNLGSVHWLFAQEHNRIAKILAGHNPTWDDNKLFFETRKIIIAVMQHIVYNEYLPIIFNSALLKAFSLIPLTSGYSKGYDAQKDATVANVFGVAAFRFAHSMITNDQKHFSPTHKLQKEVPIETTFHRPHLCIEGRGYGYRGVIRWLINDHATVADRFFETGIRDKLFPDKKGNSMDLPAININRGRDHGVPPYNAWREWCKLSRAKTFYPGVKDGLTNHTYKAAVALAKVYSHPDDIDLYAGAMSEIHVTGANVGPTFACIIGFQFEQLKFGDRFWYERDNGKIGLTPGQLAEVRKSSLSKIICDNIDVTTIQPSAFKTVSETNARVNCSSLPSMNLHAWNSQTCGGDH